MLGRGCLAISSTTTSNAASGACRLDAAGDIDPGQTGLSQSAPWWLLRRCSIIRRQAPPKVAENDEIPAIPATARWLSAGARPSPRPGVEQQRPQPAATNQRPAQARQAGLHICNAPIPHPATLPPVWARTRSRPTIASIARPWPERTSAWATDRLSATKRAGPRRRTVILIARRARDRPLAAPCRARLRSRPRSSPLMRSLREL